MKKLAIQYKLTFKSYHLKYFWLGVCFFLSNLKKVLMCKKLHFLNLTKAPHRRNHFTVIKSPFVNKSSREQFKVENFRWNLDLPFVIPFSESIAFEKVLEKHLGAVNYHNFVNLNFVKTYCFFD